MSRKNKSRPVAPPKLRPLAVHVVYQEVPSLADNPTHRLAREIYARLVRGARPSGVPIQIWTKAEHLPARPPLEDAERNAVILLIDQHFFDSRKDWGSYFESLKAAFRHGQDLLVPISICGDAHLTSDLLRDINCVQVDDPASVDKDESLLLAIFIAILNLLPEGIRDNGPTPMALPPRVFLCHTKTDGADKARKLRRYLYEHTQMSCFFDTHDIPHGRGVKEFIQASIAESCMVVIWTDHLLDSRWCQYEILEARKQQRPLIVVDALSRNAPRIFPFLGNMPVVRWKANQAEILNALLLELIRTRHTKALFEALCGEDESPNFRFHPPDLLPGAETIESRKTQQSSGTPEALIVYPDPPLAAEEQEILRLSLPNFRLQLVRVVCASIGQRVARGSS